MRWVMQNFITINGVQLPQPKRGLGLHIATLVDSARNSRGVVVGQKIGRDQQKIENVEWAVLTAKEWGDILKILDANFYVNVTYPDMVTGRWITRKMYCGDRTAEVFKIDKNTGLPTHYAYCKVNFIDVGE